MPSLREVSFSVKGGECLALLGADGSGRTTLLSLLAGLMARFYPGRLTGECLVHGSCCVGRRPKRTGFSLEDPTAQLSGLAFTVFEEVALALDGGDARGRDMAVWELLNRVGVAHLAERNPFTLSGGEAKRVALAVLLAGGPGLLLLDEPFAQLDPASRDEIKGVLGDLKARGATLVVSGNDLGEVAGLADRAVVLDGGRMVYDGPLAALPDDGDPQGWGLTVPLVTRVAQAARTRGLYAGPLPLALDDAEGRWCL
ncbi:energy-coupling factor ABC transporter ATP-binding protein [Desulfoluna spongiiphila]|uniref:energy-coupling factor ABC transporter ATP-binding protein n=1 Tax=Desulfoluna spongiiphila TaxID=419481 RepID=UPI00125B1BE8|nr:ABC transporter ATP-binding protein [Desulfoluna spongiiphila]VVS94153.1 abc transporter-like [Desulfoluna spongiiphila]